MKKGSKRNLLAVLSVLIGVAIATYYADFGQKPPISAPAPSISLQNAPFEAAAAPDFTLKDMNGHERTLAEFRGKFVILNFWASWCAPCIKEFPHFLKIAREYPEKLVFLGVSSDFNDAAMGRFLDKMKAAHPAAMAQDNVVILPDPQQKITLDLFQTMRLPETILIDANGAMRDKIIGADWDYEDLLNKLESLGFSK